MEHGTHRSERRRLNLPLPRRRSPRHAPPDAPRRAPRRWVVDAVALAALLVVVAAVLPAPVGASPSTITGTWPGTSISAGPNPARSATSAGRQAPTAGERVPDELVRRVDVGGRVPVIVELATEFAPEPHLPRAAHADQRARLRRAADGVLARLPSGSTTAVKRFQTVPLVALTVDAQGLARLAADPAVRSVQADTVDDVVLATSTQRIGVPAVRASGLDGDGTAIAVLDTGVDADHPFLTGKVVAEACFSRTLTSGGYSSTAVCPDGTNPPGTASEVGPGAAQPCPIVGTACDHGTHVAGIAAGGTGAPDSGVAPGADIIAVQVFSQFTAASCGAGATAPCARTWASDQILGLEHVYSLRDTYDIAAVNMSLAGGKYTVGCLGDARRTIIQNLAAAGIATVAASGNDGHTDGIGAPACVPEAISVGSTSKTSDTVASSSNSASFLDLLAPGVSILSSVPDGGWATYSGTSMAAPHVAGALALVADAAPGTSVQDAVDALVDTGVPVLDPKSGVTTPRIQVDAAITAVLSDPPTVTAMSPRVGAISGGTAVTVTGSGFTGTTAVRFGPTPATSFTVVDDATLTAVAPARPVGLVNVWVERPGGTNANVASSWFSYLAPPTTAPTVTSVVANAGSVEGGEAVTVSGSGFLTATSVAFGPTPAPSFTVLDDTTIVAVAPARPAGLVNVWVTNPIGVNANQPSSWYAYRDLTGGAPNVIGVSPRTGPTSGGQMVTITGTGFTTATQVRFGSTIAPAFTVVDDSTITVLTPPRDAALVNVWVSGPNGTNANQASSWYRYE